jgi:hypothetical protein
MTSFFLQPGRWRLLVNHMEWDNDDLAQLMPAGFEKVNDYILRNCTLGSVWETDDELLALQQASILWEQGIPVRIVSNAGEEFTFMRDLINLVEHPENR